MGYVAYKNGLPQAYGGSWIFRGQAKIGINIFPAYRGGESSWLFAQLIRTYSQAFGVKTFAVEPYQIGKNNPEGIESGAFWFYYRHGFRPLQAELRTLAAEEFDKINAIRRYKSASSTLRRLAESDLLLLPDGSDAQPFPIRYSRWMTEQFSSHFDGDRKNSLANRSNSVSGSDCYPNGFSTFRSDKVLNCWHPSSWQCMATRRRLLHRPRST